MTQQKNTPSPYPFGVQLQAVFDRMYAGADYAFETAAFTKERSFLAIGGGYMKCGNDVYHAEDLRAVLVATDMRDAGLMFAYDPESLGESQAQRMQYYKRFEAELGKIIEDAQMKDDNGAPLTVGLALRKYGEYRWQMIDRFDARSFPRSQGGGQSLV